jgi:hypothetical protein
METAPAPALSKLIFGAAIAAVSIASPALAQYALSFRIIATLILGDKCCSNNCNASECRDQHRSRWHINISNQESISFFLKRSFTFHCPGTLRG